MTKFSFSLAQSIRYGAYKHFKHSCEIYKDLIYHKIDIINTVLKLPEKVHIHFRPLRHMDGLAYQSDADNSFQVELDPRQPFHSFCDTLLHELVHVEQFSKGDLKFDNKKNCFKWKEKHYDSFKPSHTEYNELPWEKDAVKRAYELFQIVF